MVVMNGDSRALPASDRAGSGLRGPGGQPVRVLVVDDESILAELLSMALRYEGCEVRSAGDGRGAVRLAGEFRPDAVVLDIMLPDLNGLEVLRRLSYLRKKIDAGGTPMIHTIRGAGYVLKPAGRRPPVHR
jgi:two-component system OmpR family response regulator